MDNLIDRTTCIVCGSNNLETICETSPMPVFQGCVTSPIESDINTPMDWRICTECGSVMLAKTLPLDVIYMEGHATSLGGIWNEHHQLFATFVEKHRCGDVLEVGGGVGKLGQYYRREGGDAPWLILEPNPLNISQPESGVTFVQGFLDHKFTLPEHVETIVFSHSLEHIYDLANMIELLSEKLPDTGRLVVAWPQMDRWLQQGLPGALNWEHTFYVPIDVLLELMASRGFILNEQHDFGDGHSYFLAFSKGKKRPFVTNHDQIANSRYLVKNYWQSFEARVTAINKIIGESPTPLWVSPASVYTQYLFAFGLETSNLAGILDNAQVKQGKRLYGTPGEVESPSIIENTTCTVIINAGAHTQEILHQFSTINPSATLINAMEF
jgi:hypothetical protein